MTSQSPAESSVPTPEYVDAWNAIRVLVMEKGMSWSGGEKNRLFLNLGDRTFAEFSAVSAADSPADARGAALVDWDDDGRLDMVVKNRTAPRVQLFHNRMAGTGHFLSVSLTGTSCNRDAIGALVEVEAGGRRLRQRLYAGDSYISQSSKRLHFGLGDATEIGAVTVHWPDGKSESFTGLEADRRYHLTQGEGEARLVPARTTSTLVEASAPVSKAAPRRGMRTPLIHKLPLAELFVPTWDDPKRKVSDLAGDMVLLNVWGRECAACLKEMAVFKERRADIDAAKLRIVTLCTDPADQRVEATEVLQRFGLEAGAGVVDEQLFAAFQPILEEVLGSFEQVPLPTSLLLDSKGQLVCIYQGPVDVDVLLEDARAVARMNPDKEGATRLMGGVRLFQNPRDYATLARKFKDLGQFHMSNFYRALSTQ